MVKKIYLFTASFPYGRGEQFLETELIIAKSITQIELCIVPSKILGDRRSLPQNIKIDTSLAQTLSKNKLKKIPASFIKNGPFIFKSIFTHKFKSLKAAIRVLRYAHYAKIVDKWAREQKNDGSIYYTYWCDFITLGLILNTTRKYKVISRVHRYDLYEERHSPPFIPFRDFVVNNIEHIYSISQDGKQYLDNSFPTSAHKISVSRLGVVDNAEKKIQVEMEENVINITSCSFISHVKRLLLLAEGVISFVKSNNYKVIWNHLGGGDIHIIQEINSLVSKEELNNLKVNLLGNLENSSIIDFYKSNYVHVFLNTSSSEGIPFSIMEAISFSIPVIGCDVGGMSEIVIKNGVLLKENFDIRELSEAISIVIGDVKYRKESRNIYLKMYKAEMNFTKFYKNLVSI